ncbi:hypothetical protein LguiB_001493 [Lonicera macranthoides]
MLCRDRQETSSLVPMDDASKSVDKNPTKLNVNEVDVPASSKDKVLRTETEVPTSCSDIPPVIKEVPSNTRSLDTEVEESLKSESVCSASDNTCTEVTVTQSLDDKSQSATSILGTDPVLDITIDKGESQPVKEGSEMIEMPKSDDRDEFVTSKPDVHEPESEQTASVSMVPISDAKKFDDNAAAEFTSSTIVVDVNKDQSLEEQKCSDMVGLDFDLSKDRSVNEQGTVGVQEQESKDNALNGNVGDSQKEVASEQKTEDLNMDKAIVSNSCITLHQSLTETASSVSLTFVEPPPGFKRPMYMPEDPTEGDVKQQESKDELVRADSVVAEPSSTVNGLENAAAPVVEEGTNEQESKDPVLANLVASTPEVTENSMEGNASSAAPMVMKENGGPALASLVASNPEVTGNSLEANAVTTSDLGETASPIVIEQESGGPVFASLVASNPVVTKNSLEANALTTSNLGEMEGPVVFEQVSVDPVLANLVISNPEVAKNSSEENALTTLNMGETEVPIVIEQESKDPVLANSVASNPKVTEKSAEENALATLNLGETAAPIIIEQEIRDPVFANLVASNLERTENDSSEEKALSTSTLEEKESSIAETALKQSEDQSMNVDIDGQESLEQPLVEPQTEEPLAEPQTEEPLNTSEKNALSTSTLEETTVPIVETALNEFENEFVKMDTDEQENVDPSVISEPGEVCLEEKISLDPLLTETRESLVEPQIEEPKNNSEGNAISTSTLEETAVPIFEPALKESKVCLVEKPSSDLLLTESAEPLVEPEAEKPEKNSEENALSATTLEDNAVPIAEPAPKEFEVCLAEHATSDLLVTESAKPLVEPETEKPKNSEENALLASTLEENAVPIAEPAPKEFEVCLAEYASSDLLVTESAEPLVEPETEKPKNSEENALLATTLEENAVPIAEPAPKESEACLVEHASSDLFIIDPTEPLVEPETERPGNISEENAHSVTALEENSVPIVVPVLKESEACLEEKPSSSLPVCETAESLVEPVAEMPKKNSKENALPTLTLEENTGGIDEPFAKEFGDESAKMETDEKESIDLVLVSKPDKVCLEDKASSSLPVSENVEINRPENNSEENSLPALNRQETASPIVEPALKEFQDQSVEMDTDEQESVEPAPVSKPDEGCLEEKTSSSLPVSGTAETKRPENASEENSLLASSMGETATPIVEPALNKSEGQSAKMATDEQETIDPTLVSKPDEGCLEDKASPSLPVFETAETERPNNNSVENSLPASSMEEIATLVVEPTLKESEGQSAKMDTDEQGNVDPALVSKPDEVCIEDKASPSLPFSENAETEKPENNSNENSLPASSMEETAAPVVEPASAKMDTDEQESIDLPLVSKPDEVCVEDKASSSLPFSENAETKKPENNSDEPASSMEETAAPIVEPALKECEGQLVEMDTDEQESIEPTLISEPDVVCLEQKTSPSLPVSKTVEIEKPENNLEENSLHNSTVEETEAPIVELAVKEPEGQSAEMDTDEQESIEPALVSEPGVVCLEQKTSPSLPVSETVEIKKPENNLEENSLHNSTVEETEAPIVELAVKEPEGQSAKMDQLAEIETDEQKGVDQAFVSKPDEVCLEEKASLSETAEPFVEPRTEKTEIQNEKELEIGQGSKDFDPNRALLLSNEPQTEKPKIQIEKELEAKGQGCKDSDPNRLLSKQDVCEPNITSNPTAISNEKITDSGKPVEEDLSTKMNEEEGTSSSAAVSNEKITDSCKPVDEDLHTKMNEEEGSSSAPVSNNKITDSGNHVEDSGKTMNEEEGSSSTPDNTAPVERVKLVDYSAEDSSDDDKSVPPNEG